MTDDIRTELEFLKDLGFTHLDLAAGRERTGAPASSETIGDSGEQGAVLDEMARAISNCELCALSRGRTQTVFGVGNPNARLMFVVKTCTFPTSSSADRLTIATPNPRRWMRVAPSSSVRSRSSPPR